MKQLIQWDKIRTAIETSKDIEVLTLIKNKLRAYQVLAEQSKASMEVQAKIAIYKARADRKCGEWLQVNIKHEGAKGIGKKVPSNIQGTLKDIGVSYSESHRLQKIADIPEDKFEGILQEAEVEVKKVTSNMLVKVANEAERKNRPDKPIQEPPKGKYKTIIIDPPWPVEKIIRDVRPNQIKGLDYKIMSIEAIKTNELIIKRLADNCHVYLWTTHKFLPIAFDILKAWGVNYECLMTWVKNVGMTPFSWMYSTEHCLFGRRGSLDLLKKGVRLDFSAKVREHSRKPDEFYDIVRNVSPPPRIDIFSRGVHDGFDRSGDEIDKF